MSSHRYRKSHCGDKTVVRSGYSLLYLCISGHKITQLPGMFLPMEFFDNIGLNFAVLDAVELPFASCVVFLFLKTLFHDDVIKWKQFSALLAFCAGNSPVSGDFPAQRPVTRRFDAFFDLRLDKRLSKQSWGLWSETPSRSLWRHYNAVYVYCIFS